MNEVKKVDSWSWKQGVKTLSERATFPLIRKLTGNDGSTRRELGLGVCRVDTTRSEVIVDLLVEKEFGCEPRDYVHFQCKLDSVEALQQWMQDIEATNEILFEHVAKALLAGEGFGVSRPLKGALNSAIGSQSSISPSSSSYDSSAAVSASVHFLLTLPTLEVMGKPVRIRADATRVCSPANSMGAALYAVMKALATQAVGSVSAESSAHSHALDGNGSGILRNSQSDHASGSNGAAGRRIQKRRRPVGGTRLNQ